MGTTAEKLAYLADTKTDIKNAIVAKGVEVPEGTTFRGYAGLISGISTGLSDEALALANATPEDVTAGKTFYAGGRELKTGTASAAVFKVLDSGTRTISSHGSMSVPSNWLFAIFLASTTSTSTDATKTFIGGITKDNTTVTSNAGYSGYLNYFSGSTNFRVYATGDSTINFYKYGNSTVYISYKIFGLG